MSCGRGLKEGSTSAKVSVLLKSGFRKGGCRLDVLRCWARPPGGAGGVYESWEEKRSNILHWRIPSHGSAAGSPLVSILLFFFLGLGSLSSISEAFRFFFCGYQTEETIVSYLIMRLFR